MCTALLNSDYGPCSQSPIQLRSSSIPSSIQEETAKSYNQVAQRVNIVTIARVLVQKGCFPASSLKTRIWRGKKLPRFHVPTTRIGSGFVLFFPALTGPLVSTLKFFCLDPILVLHGHTVNQDFLASCVCLPSAYLQSVCSSLLVIPFTTNR